MKKDELVKGIELAGKTLIATPVILYVLGFCIVTFHLARYHILQFEIARGQYLLSAISILLPLIVWALFLPAIANLLSLLRFARTMSCEQIWTPFKNIAAYSFAVSVMLVKIDFFRGD